MYSLLKWRIVIDICFGFFKNSSHKLYIKKKLKMLEIKLVDEISERFMKSEWSKKLKKFKTNITGHTMSNVFLFFFISNKKYELKIGK